MKILMAFADYNHNEKRKKENAYGGIGYYRIVKVAEQIKSHEVKVIGKEILHFGNTLEEQWDNIFKEYDVFWTNYFSDERAGTAMLYHAQKHGKKVIIDCDDNYLDVPQSNLLYDKFKQGKKDRAILSTILSLADIITTSTEPLKERLYSHFKTVHNIEKKIVVIPNFNDINDWNYTPAEKHSDIIIGYTGSNSHHDDLKLVLNPICNVMQKYKDIRFQLLGVVGTNSVDSFFHGFPRKVLDRIDLVGATETFRMYPEWLSKMKWDIGIAPLVDTNFTRSKSHIKWMEYAMYKIPTIASRVYPYFYELNGRETIRNGETGILVKPNEWEKALENLIEDKQKRLTIGENAYKFVKDVWQYKDSNIDSIVSKMLCE